MSKSLGNVILGKECKTIFGEDYITDILCDVKIRISPLSFYQVNRNQAEKLYNKAAEYAALTGKETVLDLYCGAGSIGLSMAKEVGELIGIEIVDSAVECARFNAENNGIENASFYTGDAKDGYWEDTQYTYFYGNPGEEVYFVDPYGKTKGQEDRARLMEYIMCADWEAEQMMKHPVPKAKLQLMCDAIREVFDTSEWNDIRWERFSE